MDNGKIFGREPALWIGAIGSVLMILANLGVDFLTAGAVSAIVAVLTAIGMALTTEPKSPALFTGIWTAAAALLLEYGLELGDELISTVSASIIAVFALITREQVAPRETRVSRS